MKRPLFIFGVIAILLIVGIFLFVRKSEMPILPQPVSVPIQKSDGSTEKTKIDVPRNVEKQNSASSPASGNETRESKIKWITEHSTTPRSDEITLSGASNSFEGLNYQRPFELKTVGPILSCDYKNKGSDMFYGAEPKAIGVANNTYLSVTFKMWALSNHGFVFKRNENPIQTIGFAYIVGEENQELDMRLMSNKVLQNLEREDLLKFPEERLGADCIVLGIQQFDYTKPVRVLWMKINPDGTLKITSPLPSPSSTTAVK